MEFTSRRRLLFGINLFYFSAAISISFFFLLFAFPGNLKGEPVPDTGQKTCWDEEGNIIECRAPGSPLYGQDANYNINAPSFTKLDTDGNELSFSETSWAMVRDNVVGLIWEVKTNKDGNKNYGNPHDADNTYTWYDGNPETNGGVPGEQGEGTDTEDFIRELNNAGFGGFTDWRLPTIRELRFIADYGRLNASINTTYFSDIPNAYMSRYWSSSTYSEHKDNAWWMDFATGFDSFGFKGGATYVRAVRGAHSEPLDNYVNNGDGTVSDKSTGLMWQQETPKETFSWAQALSYCENLGLANYSDWRLPSIKELESIIDPTKFNPAVNTSFFSEIMAANYWSSTSYALASYNGLGVDFIGGYITGNGKAIPGYVRAVRGGRSTALNLEDIICGLQLVIDDIPQCCCKIAEDVNNDGKIGIAEVIHALQTVSGLR